MKCWKNRCLYSNVNLKKKGLPVYSAERHLYALFQQGFYANHTYQIFKTICAWGEILLIISASFSIFKELWLQSFTEMYVQGGRTLSRGKYNYKIL